MTTIQPPVYGGGIAPFYPDKKFNHIAAHTPQSHSITARPITTHIAPDKQLADRHLGMPPALIGDVSSEEIEHTIDELLTLLKPGTNHIATESSGVNRLPQLEMSMDELLSSVTLVSLTNFAQLVELKSRVLDIMAANREKISLDRVQKVREECDKAIEQARQAKKGATISTGLDWLFAGINLIVGAFKVVTGVLTANPLMITAGALNLASGVAGIVKATANTLALIDSNNAEKYRKIADIASYLELGLGLTAAAVDITSAAMTALKGKLVAQTAKEILSGTAGKGLHTALQQGASVTTAKITEDVAQRVALRVSEKMLNTIAENSLQRTSTFSQLVGELGFNRLAEACSKKAIATVVRKSMQEVIKKEIQHGLQKSAEELTKALVKQINKDVYQALAKAIVQSGAIQAALQGTLLGTKQVSQGVIGLDIAKLKKEISELIKTQQLLAWLQEHREADIKKEQREISNVSKAQNENLKMAIEAMAENSAQRAQIAAAIA
jgi:secreted effector protein SseC